MNLQAPLVGHVGDGNFHLLYLIESGDQEQFKKAKSHNKWMVEIIMKALFLLQV